MSTREMLAQAGGMIVVFVLFALVAWRQRYLERKVWREAAAPLPGRTRDLPAARREPAA